MATFTEGQHKAGWLKHELDGYMSRRIRTVVSGQNLITGTLIGFIGSSGSATSAVKASGANTGNPTFGAFTITASALPGLHTLRFLTATTFEVEDPLGNPVGTGTTGVAFSAGGIAFTLTAGGTPAITGDGFDITVVITRKVKIADPTATDGSAICCGIILDTIDATAADHADAVTIEATAVVNEALASTAAPALAVGWQGTITFGAGFTTAAQKTVARAQLLALGIIIRN